MLARLNQLLHQVRSGLHENSLLNKANLSESVKEYIMTITLKFMYSGIKQRKRCMFAIAQWLERQVSESEAGGSNPLRATRFFSFLFTKNKDRLFFGQEENG